MKCKSVLTQSAPVLFIAVFAVFFAFPAEEAQASVNLNGLCSPHSQTVYVGEPVVFSVEAWGGTGVFRFIWTGDEGLSGTGQSVTKVYENSGKKSAQVFITSGGQTISPECSVEVVELPPSLTGSCFPHSDSVLAGTPVEWSVYVSGGGRRTSYSWSGDDDLSGRRQSVSHTYNTPGIKEARVLVESGNQSMLRTCQVSIVPNPPISASCSSDFPAVPLSRALTWTAKASGGTGEYSFSWSGTDGLRGSNQAVSHKYSSLGVKTANVHIISGSQSATVSCSARVMTVTKIIEEDLLPADDPIVLDPADDSDPEETEGRRGFPDTRASVFQVGLGGRLVIFVFFGILVLWSVLVAYILYRRSRRKEDEQQKKKESLSTGLKIDYSEDDNEEVEDLLDETAKDNKVLVGERGIHFIKESAGGDKNKALEILNRLIMEKKKNGDEDWNIIDADEVKEFVENLS